VTTVGSNLFSVKEDVPIGITLNAYLRDYCKLKGTKYMCYEGGCGACVVSVVSKHPVTKKEMKYAVNSVSLFSLCSFWIFFMHFGLGN